MDNGKSIGYRMMDQKKQGGAFGCMVQNYPGQWGFCDIEALFKLLFDLGIPVDRIVLFDPSYRDAVTRRMPEQQGCMFVF